jgi:hypothetical protein
MNALDVHLVCLLPCTGGEESLFIKHLSSSQGHVALITALMCRIAELKPQLQSSVHVIFIASEELPWPGVGIDEMMKRGDCEHVMGGMCARQLCEHWHAAFSALTSSNAPQTLAWRPCLNALTMYWVALV